MRFQHRLPDRPHTHTRPDAHIPQPRSERGAWAAAVALATVGAAVVALALSGALGGAPPPVGAPPIVAVAPTPSPAVSAAATATAAANDTGGASVTGGATGGASVTGGATGGATGTGALRGTGAGSVADGARAAIVGASGAVARGASEAAVYEGATSTYIPESWMRGFYPIYATAQRTFGVNWLLIASIHRQESAFSTSPGIYRGLNFAGCCGGPMQFNVTNRPVTTWSLVSDSYRYGARPAAYDHPTATHPSIYDDFDAIMAAAHLLSADGATFALDGGAWGAAYDYYGHDAAGVAYADEVLARAIYWSQHGFCANCGTPRSMVLAVHAAYGAPVAAALEAQAAPAPVAKPARPTKPTKPAKRTPR